MRHASDPDFWQNCILFTVYTTSSLHIIAPEVVIVHGLLPGGNSPGGYCPGGDWPSGHCPGATVLQPSLTYKPVKHAANLLPMYMYLTGTRTLRNISTVIGLCLGLHVVVVAVVTCGDF